jgi:hypothetical protein
MVFFGALHREEPVPGTEQELGVSFEQEDGDNQGDDQGAVRSAHTPSLLGTLRNARSWLELTLWRDRAWRRRAGQAFKLGGPDVADGTTAMFIHRRLSRAATG